MMEIITGGHHLQHEPSHVRADASSISLRVQVPFTCPRDPGKIDKQGIVPTVTWGRRLCVGGIANSVIDPPRECRFVEVPHKPDHRFSRCHSRVTPGGFGRCRIKQANYPVKSP